MLKCQRRELGERAPQVRRQWGIAEQAGVNFGIAIAAPRKAKVDTWTAVEIDVFVSFGNLYRAAIANEVWTWPVVGRFVDTPLDPRTTTSRQMVRALSVYVISPLSAGLAGIVEESKYPHQWPN